MFGSPTSPLKSPLLRAPGLLVDTEKVEKFVAASAGNGSKLVMSEEPGNISFVGFQQDFIELPLCFRALVDQHEPGESGHQAGEAGLPAAALESIPVEPDQVPTEHLPLPQCELYRQSVDDQSVVVGHIPVRAARSKSLAHYCDNNCRRRF